MTPTQPDTFVIALPRSAQLGDPVEARGASGRIIESLSREEYIRAWADAGCPNLGICRRPNFFYRVERDRQLTALQTARAEHAREF
jgi:hypothetical protein